MYYFGIVLVVFTLIINFSVTIFNLIVLCIGVVNFDLYVLCSVSCITYIIIIVMLVSILKFVINFCLECLPFSFSFMFILYMFSEICTLLRFIITLLTEIYSTFMFSLHCLWPPATCTAQPTCPPAVQSPAEVLQD